MMQRGNRLNRPIDHPPQEDPLIAKDPLLGVAKETLRGTGDAIKFRRNL
jgi:hypothetical protein